MFSENQSQGECPASSTGQAEKSVALADKQNWFAPPTWLVTAVTAESVRNGLLCHVPEFASGRLMLSRCEIKRLRFRAGQGCWSGTYLLTIEGLPSGRQIVPVDGTVIAQGRREPAARTPDYPFGTEQWRCYLPDLRLELRTQQADTELAALPQLTDPEQARHLLEEGIRRGSRVSNGQRQAGANARYGDLHIQSCRPQVVRYKPGSRCTVLYHLEVPDQLAAGHNWPTLMVGKTYNSDKGQHVFDGMQALWRSPLGTSKTVTIAEPLAYLPELNLLVQGPVRHELTLKELIRRSLRTSLTSAAHGPPEVSDELAMYLRKTAAGLAELHQCGVQYGKSVTWEDELAEIYQQRAQLASSLPQLAGLAEDLLHDLQSLAAVQCADPLAPSHRSFRPAQVLLHQGEVGFIDFDDFGQAEPAMDLALFRTTVKHLALSKSKLESEDEDEDQSERVDPETRLGRLAQAEAICELFLLEYEKHAPVSRARIALWEALNLLSLVVGSWSKLKFARLDNCLFMLQQHVLATFKIS